MNRSASFTAECVSNAKENARRAYRLRMNLRFLAYNDFKGNFHEARESFWELPREIRNIRCSDCSECVVQCPNGVKVHERLIRAQELLA